MSWASGTELSTAFEPVPWPHGRDEQFAAGRRAAAGALAAAGSADREVPREADGRPRFPPGFAGSISHTAGLAVAVVVPGAVAVGVDIEDAIISPRVARFVLRERERRELEKFTPRELFAAKEAAFKAIGGRLLFWQMELSRSGDTLIASSGDLSVPVWVRTPADMAFAVAIRHS
jgi:4'-phosphopantetheinyl transferase EntD